MRDQFYPGWKVFVDGTEQPLLQANLFNRAVFVQAGEHRVVFQYCPESLITGYELAGGGFLAAIILSLILHFRAKSIEKPDPEEKLPEAV